MYRRSLVQHAKNISRSQLPLASGKLVQTRALDSKVTHSFSPASKMLQKRDYSFRRNVTPTDFVVHWLDYAIKREPGTYKTNLEPRIDCIERAEEYARNARISDWGKFFQQVKGQLSPNPHFPNAKDKVFQEFRERILVGIALNELVLLGVDRYKTNHLQFDEKRFERHIKRSVNTMKRCDGFTLEHVRVGLLHRLAGKVSKDDANNILPPLFRDVSMAWHGIDPKHTPLDNIRIGPRGL